MATIKGIELASDIYDLEDTQGRAATQTAQETATNASDKADSNETAIEDIQAVIPSNASSSNKLVAESDVPEVTDSINPDDSDAASSGSVYNYTLRFCPHAGPETAGLLLSVSNDWGTSSNKALLKAYSSSGSLIWAGIAQWTGKQLGEILNRSFSKYAGSGEVTASNEQGTVAFSETPAYTELFYIGVHD